MTPLARLSRFYSNVPRRDHDAEVMDDPFDASERQLDVQSTARAMLAAAARAEGNDPLLPAPTGVAAQMLAAYRKSQGELSNE